MDGSLTFQADIVLVWSQLFFFPSRKAFSDDSRHLSNDWLRPCCPSVSWYGTAEPYSEVMAGQTQYPCVDVCVKQVQGQRGRGLFPQASPRAGILGQQGG